MDDAAPFSLRLELPGPAATDALGTALASEVRPGDTVLLVGQIGAGKSHLARCLIQSVMTLWGTASEEVPSPTFTLVQTYDTPQGEIWHADLYRLTDPSELTELGLSDAFGTALTLVEWPDRLGHGAPADALTLRLTPMLDGAARQADLAATAPRWHGPLLRLSETGLAG